MTERLCREGVKETGAQNRIKDIFPTNFAFCFSVSCSGKVKVSGNP